MQMFKKLALALFLIALATGSCRRQAAEDLSLDAEAYKKLGMPEYKTVWTNKDYSDANITLSGLIIDYPLSLPRKNSNKSGELFNRFVNEENLSFANDETLPLHLRAYRIQDFETLQSRMEQIYAVETEEEKYYRGELISLKIFRLSVHEKMLELAWKIMNSDDEADINLQPGMQTVRDNFLKLIAGLLEEQVNLKEYDLKDLEKLSKRVSVSLINNNHWFSSDDRDSLFARINNVIKGSSSDVIRNNYSKALKVLDSEKSQN